MAQLPPDVLFDRLAGWCARAERSPRRVRQKLMRLGGPMDDAEAILERLEAEDFLNHERFARAYVHDKHVLNGWGLQKLKHGLRGEGIHEAAAEAALRDVLPPADAYTDRLREELRKKQRRLKLDPATADRPETAKLVRFLMSKGYRWEAIKTALELEGFQT